jgi:hypothetical protein
MEEEQEAQTEIHDKILEELNHTIRELDEMSKT